MSLSIYPIHIFATTDGDWYPTNVPFYVCSALLVVAIKYLTNVLVRGWSSARERPEEVMVAVVVVVVVVVAVHTAQYAVHRWIHASCAEEMVERRWS